VVPITRNELLEFLDDLEERNLQLIRGIEEDSVELEGINVTSPEEVAL
jgi:hypothetical protein